MSRAASPLHYSLYFVDVLACLLFAITLSLVGARFAVERTAPIELPRTEGGAGGIAPAVASEVSLARGPGGTELHFDGEPVGWDELEARLRATPPGALVIRSEASDLARLVAIAHASGVPAIRVAYEDGPPRPTGDDTR